MSTKEYDTYKITRKTGSQEPFKSYDLYKFLKSRNLIDEIEFYEHIKEHIYNIHKPYHDNTHAKSIDLLNFLKSENLINTEEFLLCLMKKELNIKPNEKIEIDKLVRYVNKVNNKLDKN
tara:strand:+ start:96 stop:452 length:357 start_codon:yes stop_codon:yes gene_type:complete